MWNQDFNQSGFDQGGGFNTPQTDEKKRTAKRSNNVVPVTVAQILTAKHDDDCFMSGTLELSQVTLVGLLKSVSSASTRIDYTIDDMTGPPLEVRKFQDSDENEQGDDPNSNVIPANTYVRVIGLLRAFGGKRTINAHKVTPITDMNELTCHMLEVIYASAQSQKLASGVSNHSGRGEAMDTGFNGQISGLTPLQSQVQSIIRADQSEGGCTIDEICKQLKSVAPKAIRDAIEFLSGEGHIYSTIDDEHYQATDI